MAALEATHIRLPKLARPAKPRGGQCARTDFESIPQTGGLTDAPLAVVLACLLEPPIHTYKMSSGFGLTGGMCMPQQNAPRGGGRRLPGSGRSALAKRACMLTTTGSR